MRCLRGLPLLTSGRRCYVYSGVGQLNLLLCFSLVLAISATLSPFAAPARESIPLSISPVLVHHIQFTGIFQRGGNADLHGTRERRREGEGEEGGGSARGRLIRGTCEGAARQIRWCPQEWAGAALRRGKLS